jgi:glycosyltransferase involved in cell wall biosynthesis
MASCSQDTGGDAAKRPNLRVCLIATELQGFGPYGGFGVLTYDLARGVAAKGVDVYITMPRRDGQAPVERIGPINVVSYKSPLYVGLRRVVGYSSIYRAIDADVYHSQEPSLGTALAQIGSPGRRHIVTFQDPRDPQDWILEWAHRDLRKKDLYKFWFRYLWETGRAARRADATYCQAHYIRDKTRRMYFLRSRPGFLPNPVHVPETTPIKANKPTVCYVGRWDERKRPELFFELAAKFPQVDFIAVGACLNDPSRDHALREQCANVPNLTAPGWLSAEARGDVFERAWVLVNTSTRECLPVTYLEAGARRCAVLSHGNADDFARQFGYWARKGDLADFTDGLNWLLRDNRWQGAGEKAYGYVQSTHGYDAVIDVHMRTYESLLPRTS